LFPERADRLAGQIEQRLQIESLPVTLVQQIDAINEVVGGAASFFADKTPRAAYFRLVDQHDEPIESSAFQITCNGDNKSLLSFDAGYHLFTYLNHNRSRESPCRLQITQHGLENKSFEITGSWSEVIDAGMFRVKLMGDEDRQPAIVRVVDAQGEPLAGISIMFSLMSSRGSKIPPAKTDEQGLVEMQLLPGKYRCYTNLPHYTQAVHSFEIKPNALEPNTFEMKLHRLITATVKIKWRAEITGHPNQPQPSGEKMTTGEIELRHGAQGRNSRSPNQTVPWIRLLQKDDQLQLQFIERRTHSAAGRTNTSWIGRVETPEDPAVDFESIDLEKMDDWKKKAKVLSPNQSVPGQTQPIIAVKEKGAIYIGKINSVGRQGRYPQVIDFKILVTELGDSGDSIDAQ